MEAFRSLLQIPEANFQWTHDEIDGCLSLTARTYVDNAAAACRQGLAAISLQRVESHYLGQSNKGLSQSNCS